MGKIGQCIRLTNRAQVAQERGLPSAHCGTVSSKALVGRTASAIPADVVSPGSKVEGRSKFLHHLFPRRGARKPLKKRPRCVLTACRWKHGGTDFHREPRAQPPTNPSRTRSSDRVRSASGACCAPTPPAASGSRPAAPSGRLRGALGFDQPFLDEILDQVLGHVLYLGHGHVVGGRGRLIAPWINHMEAGHMI